MWKELWQKIKNPKPWLIVLAFVGTAVFGGFSVISLFLDIERAWFDILSYICYGFAAVFLAYAVYICVRILPKLYRSGKEKLRAHKWFGRLIDDYGLRTVVFAGVSTALTLAFAIYHGVTAILVRSVWYGALAAYYVLLIGMRGGIVFYHGRKRGKERDGQLETRKYRNCGIAMSTTILVLSVAVAQMVATGAAFERPGLMIYVVAAYTFYKVTMSIVHFVKAKRQDDFTVEALRNVNVADAAVSLLALQTSMLKSFSEGGLDYVNAITGGGVCALVFGLGIYMIIRGSRAMKKRKKNGENYAK
ncbi:MAG: hypothetical protein IJ308_02205 [Clostridia bacterium]|nr:hypothetical protein [Clostridia bacterium]